MVTALWSQRCGHSVEDDDVVDDDDHHYDDDGGGGGSGGGVGGGGHGGDGTSTSKYARVRVHDKVHSRSTRVSLQPTFR